MSTMNYLRCMLLALCVCMMHTARAQSDSLSTDTLHDAEIRLMGLGEKMILSYDENERLLCSRNFLITLSRALRINRSYFYRFDSLKYISILYSPDRAFRIFSWNVALNNETFHNFGVIQLNPDYMATLKDTSHLRAVYPLIDRSGRIKNTLDTVTGPDFWFGAVYYQLHMVKEKKRTYYFLIGWNGGTQLTNKKVVDVLYFDHNRPRFGAPVFVMNEARYPRPLKRLLYEYSNKGTMTLRVSPKKNYLIIENIVPPRQQDYGHPETYLPDGSYEYMLWQKGQWHKKGPLRDFDLE
jgi:hypothetical protein